MRCLNRLGTNVLIQDEANDGRWATVTPCCWQPLDWMGSAWRAVSDPSVSFAYGVNPMMVGNLADLPFDGQSAITQRGLGGACNYIGDGTPQAGDPADRLQYAGPKPGFLALAPWVVGDGPRSQLSAVAGRLAPGSGDALENDYVETALIADLTFPPDPHRPACLTQPGSVTTSTAAPGPGSPAGPFARVVARRIPVRGGRALVALACAGAGGSVCRGHLRLRAPRPVRGSRGRHPGGRLVALGSAPYDLSAGATKRVPVALDHSALARLRRHGSPAEVDVLPASGPTSFFPVRLGRSIAPARRRG
jgi:hypothetical protein